MEKKKKAKPKLTPIVKSFKGSFKIPENFEYKEELRKSRSEKTSLDE